MVMVSPPHGAGGAGSSDDDETSASGSGGGSEMIESCARAGPLKRTSSTNTRQISIIVFRRIGTRTYVLRAFLSNRAKPLRA